MLALAAHVAGALRQADRSGADVYGALWIGPALALAVAVTWACLVASQLGNVAEELAGAAGRIGEGDFSVRTRLPGNDEFAELGHTLDRLASSLALNLGELRAERDLQKKILEAMHDGVVVVDRDGRIKLVNSALRPMLRLG